MLIALPAELPPEDVAAEVVVVANVVVSVKVCVAEPLLLALVLAVTCVLSFEVPAPETTVPHVVLATVEAVDEADVVVVVDDDMALSMSASKSMMRLPRSTSGQLSLSSNSKLSAGFLTLLTLLELPLVNLPGLVCLVVPCWAALVVALLTLTGCTSSCIGRDGQVHQHGGDHTEPLQI